jgi:hypothetical protein
VTWEALFHTQYSTGTQTGAIINLSQVLQECGGLPTSVEATDPAVAQQVMSELMTGGRVLNSFRQTDTHNFNKGVIHLSAESHSSSTEEFKHFKSRHGNLSN